VSQAYIVLQLPGEPAAPRGQTAQAGPPKTRGPRPVAAQSVISEREAVVLYDEAHRLSGPAGRAARRYADAVAAGDRLRAQGAAYDLIHALPRKELEVRARWLRVMDRISERHQIRSVTMCLRQLRGFEDITEAEVRRLDLHNARGGCDTAERARERLVHLRGMAPKSSPPTVV
jgi:hypothetical protein